MTVAIVTTISDSTAPKHRLRTTNPPGSGLCAAHKSVDGGGVCVYRVTGVPDLRDIPADGTRMTADELLTLPRGVKRFELVEGVLRVMEPGGMLHGTVASRINLALTTHVVRGALGVCPVADTGYLVARAPETVRAPDASFIAQDRIDAVGMTERYWPEGPALAVEVVSPTQSRAEVEEKARDYLSAGTRLVLVVDPPSRTIAACRPDGRTTLHREGDTIDASDAVPGWTFPVADAFV